MIKTNYFSKQGKNKLNQDSILQIKSENEIYLFAIADGMGGEKGGNLASNYSLNTVQELFNNNNQISMKDLFKFTSEKLNKLSKVLPEYSNMATTLTICIIKNNTAYIGHVGDCRIYHLRDKGIMSRTKDQTEVQKLIDDKILTKSLAKNYHRKNILLSLLSNSIDYNLQEDTFDIINGDRILLLSDGVYNVLKNKIYIRDLSIKSLTINNLLYKIEETIEKEKIIDDYSCIGIEIT